MGKFVKGNRVGAEALARWREAGNRSSHRKGQKHTAETKAKMSVARTGSKNPAYGKPLSEKHRDKLSENHARISGENHWNWKGGKTTPDRAERMKFRRKLQQAVFVRDNYTCQVCDVYGGSMQVDHIKAWADYPELRFEIDNCRTLCMACHYYITFKRKLPQGVIWGHNLSKRISK